MNTLDEIDTRISILEADLLGLRRQRNTMVPFGKMPNELILRILRIAQQPAFRQPDYTNALRDIFREPSETWDPMYNRDLSWLKLTSTCKWLRVFALMTPEIWQKAGVWIPGSEQWRDICLARSAGLPPLLHLKRWSKYRKYDKDDDENWAEVLNELIPTTAELHLDLDVPFDEPNYNVDYEEDYDLCLGVGGQCKKLRYLSVYQRSWVLTDETLLDTCDTLTTLVLFNVTYVPELGRATFINLRNFMITVIKPDLDHNTDVYLFQWISTFTHLEALSIQYAYEEEPTGQLRSTSVLPSVLLPQLRILRLKSSVCGLVKLLSPFPINGLLGLDVSALETTISRRTINTDPMLGARLKDIIQTAVRFWERHTSFTQPPGLLCAALVTHPSADDGRAHDHTSLSLRSSPPWEPVDNTRPFCFFEGPYCDFDSCPHAEVTVLHIPKDYGGVPEEFGEQYHIDEMPLETLFLEGLKSRSQEEWNSIRIMKLWLVKRQQDGQAIRTLRIGKQTTRRAQRELRETAVDLRTRQVVEEVVWHSY